MLWLDDYDRRARLVPGLLAVLPIAIAVVALGARDNPVVSTIGGLLSTAGGPVILASYVRHRGLALQERLFAEWGGAPTTQRLRWGGPPAEEARRQQLRSRLATTLAVTFPTENEEAENPVAADSRYIEAVGHLIARSRDVAHFPLVFKENRNYGYERNLLAMKPPALLIAAAAALALVAAAAIDFNRRNSLIGLAAVGGIVAIWLAVPNETRVRRIADAYADRLFEACLSL